MASNNEEGFSGKKSKNMMKQIKKSMQSYADAIPDHVDSLGDILKAAYNTDEYVSQKVTIFIRSHPSSCLIR